MEFKNRDLMKPHYNRQILPVPSGPSLYWVLTQAGLKYENAPLYLSKYEVLTMLKQQVYKLTMKSFSHKLSYNNKLITILNIQDILVYMYLLGWGGEVISGVLIPGITEKKKGFKMYKEVHNCRFKNCS